MIDVADRVAGSTRDAGKVWALFHVADDRLAAARPKVPACTGRTDVSDVSRLVLTFNLLEAR